MEAPIRRHIDCHATQRTKASGLGQTVWSARRLARKLGAGCRRDGPGGRAAITGAGPTGYVLARSCAEAGISCVVAAPSKIRPAADRVKTDRRNAERLARLLRLGEITAVRVPGPDEEAARDLVRAREDARGDLMRARHRLSKLLLRHGAVYDATA